MDRNKLMTVAIMAVLLAGGYLIGSMSKPPGLTPAAKPPKQDCLDGHPPSCRIKVDPRKEFWVPEVTVISGTGNRPIFFDFDPGVNDYKFVVPGIKVDVPDPPPGQPKKYECTVIAGNKSVKCDFTRDKFGVHKYAIHVQKDGAPKPEVYDPYLINE